MKLSQTSLKRLEVFQLTARHGSVKVAAREAGLSVSTVSHHLRCLEETLGIHLLDHTKRPMTLTPYGTILLPYVDSALAMLDSAQIAVFSNQITETRSLRLGLIEDFDSEVAPHLALHLAASLPKCQFSHFTRPSHDVIDLIRRRELDVGVAAQPSFEVENAVEYPLLRDPFVLAVPAMVGLGAEDYLEGRSDLPLIRYSQRLLIGTRIETQLRRMRLRPPNRFEFESNQSVLGLVAENKGWAITTPTNYYRALRFQSRLTLLPFPGRGFSRYISVYTTPGYNSGVVDLILTTLRRQIQSHVIDPTCEKMPWLRPGFHLFTHSNATEDSGTMP